MPSQAEGNQPALAERPAAADRGAGVDHPRPRPAARRSSASSRIWRWRPRSAPPSDDRPGPGAADLRPAARDRARADEEPADEADRRPSGHQGARAARSKSSNRRPRRRRRRRRSRPTVGATPAEASRASRIVGSADRRTDRFSAGSRRGRKTSGSCSRPCRCYAPAPRGGAGRRVAAHRADAGLHDASGAVPVHCSARARTPRSRPTSSGSQIGEQFKIIDSAAAAAAAEVSRTACVLNLLGAIGGAGGRPRLCGVARVSRHQPPHRRRRAGGAGACRSWQRCRR